MIVELFLGSGRWLMSRFSQNAFLLVSVNTLHHFSIGSYSECQYHLIWEEQKFNGVSIKKANTP